MIARGLLALALVASLTACGGQKSAGAGAAGLEGKVVISPSTPHCSAGRSCSRPAVGVTLVFSKYGKQVLTTKTGKDGSYRVALPQGRYAISVRGHRAVAPTVKPASATVSAGRYAKLDLTLDVGIR
jgi:hypothetical protein